MKGIYTALMTPFSENGKVNEKALETLIKHNVNMGVDGFYVCGSTGEAFLLSTDERKQVMDIVKATAPDLKLIAHIGSIDERVACELGEYANKLGYDAVSSVAPFYYKFTFDEIKNYYSRLADASGLPMLVYHIPAFSGVNMGVKEMNEFLSKDNVLGLKFTSNDFFALEQCKAAFPDKLVFNGYDEMFLAGLSMGADGAIGSTYNFMADKIIALKNAFEKNDIAAAQALQKEVNRIVAVLCKVGVLQAEKEVMNQLGIDFGICRRPFSELNSEQKELIKNEVIPFITKI